MHCRISIDCMSTHRSTKHQSDLSIPEAFHLGDAFASHLVKVQGTQMHVSGCPAITDKRMPFFAACATSNASPHYVIHHRPPIFKTSKHHETSMQNVDQAYDTIGNKRHFQEIKTVTGGALILTRNESRSVITMTYLQEPTFCLRSPPLPRYRTVSRQQNRRITLP